MRSVVVAILAVLAIAPGCLVLAVPPVAGAGTGVLIAASRDGSGEDVSVFNHMLVGGLIGVAIDVVVSFALIESLRNSDVEIRQDPGTLRMR
jgi:hypothetical protein